MPAWFWYIALLYRYSCIVAATFLSPFSPFEATIYRPSLLYFGFFTLPLFPFLYPSFIPPPHTTFLPLSPHSYNMPIPLLYRSVLHYIQLYGLCYLRQHTAVTHDENNALSLPAPHLSVSWLELLYDSFSPSSNHKPSKDMIAMATHFFRYRFKVWSCLCLFWSCLHV